MAKLILLDTDVLIDFFRGYSKAVAFVNEYNARIILSAKTLNTKHYPMLKSLKPAYTK